MFSQNPVPSPVLVRPQRILLIRFSGVSGVIETIPAMNALRERFPKAEIAFLSEKENSELLNGHPALNRLMFAEKNWYKTLSGIRHLRQRLRIFKPDATLDFQGQTKSAIAAWLSGAGTRIGFTGNNTSFGSRIFNNILFTQREKDGIERNLTLLETFNIFGTSIAFDLPECETDKRNVSAMLNRNGINGNFAVFHIGCSAKPSRWTEEQLADIAKELPEQWNLPVLVVCTDGKETDKAEAVTDKTDGTAYLMPKITVPEYAVIARMALLAAGTCSELLSVAYAAGTPVVNFDTCSNVDEVCNSCEAVLSKLSVPEDKALKNASTMPFRQDFNKVNSSAVKNAA
jgi:ADP-heptose:LPS heptosyltransferase